MKPNRSDIFTTGLCNTLDNPNLQDLRFFFFEVDTLDYNIFKQVSDLYFTEEIDFLVHRTHQGWHWLSPTMLIKEYWKKLHDQLKDINPKCPMICLRVEPNKYQNESDYWYNNKYFTFSNNHYINSYDMCIYLNHIFHSNFSGSGRQKLKIVRYPLPLTGLEATIDRLRHERI